MRNQVVTVTTRPRELGRSDIKKLVLVLRRSRYSYSKMDASYGRTDLLIQRAQPVCEHRIEYEYEYEYRDAEYEYEYEAEQMPEQWRAPEGAIRADSDATVIRAASMIDAVLPGRHSTATTLLASVEPCSQPDRGCRSCLSPLPGLSG